MKNDEIKRFIELLKKLNEDKQKELYFMILGAALRCDERRYSS